MMASFHENRVQVLWKLGKWVKKHADYKYDSMTATLDYEPLIPYPFSDIHNLNIL